MGKVILAVVVALSMVPFVWGCKKQEPAAGKQIKGATEKTERMGKEAEEAGKKAVKDVQE